MSKTSKYGPFAAAQFASLASVFVLGCSAVALDSSDEAAFTAGASGDDEPSDERDPEGSSGGDPAGGAGETGGAGDDGGTSANDGEAVPTGEGCPDAWPEAWIFCEDFESLEDPADVFFEYHDAQGAFVLDDTEGASGRHSMRATYQAGSEGAGWVSVSFGANPIAKGLRPQVSAEQHFDEIYWRFRIKTEQGWPDVTEAGAQVLTRAMSFAADDWRQAMLVELSSSGADSVVTARGATCVEDGVVACTGYNDSDALQWFDPIVGQTPLFSALSSDVWHCVEVRVRLNTPGLQDGVLEFSIDGLLEGSRSDIDFRGTWDDYGINFVALENTWVGGAPGVLSRWLDDLVISTEPIGCDAVGE